MRNKDEDEFFDYDDDCEVTPIDLWFKDERGWDEDQIDHHDPIDKKQDKAFREDR